MFLKDKYSTGELFVAMLTIMVCLSLLSGDLFGPDILYPLLSLLSWRSFTSLTPLKSQVDKLDTINKSYQSQLDKQCNENTLPIKKEVIAMKNSFDIELMNEDYTIGKVVEYILYQKHFENDKIFDYVGFCKFHPHDDSATIRIAFNNSENANKVNICNIMKASCNDAINLIYNNIITSFK